MSWRYKNYSDIIHNLSVTIFDFINSNEVCDRNDITDTFAAIVWNDEYVVEEIVKFIEEKLKMQEYENYVSSWIFCSKNWNLSNVNRRGIFRANIGVFFHFSGKETNILLRASQLIIRIRESSVMLSFDPLKCCQSVLILQFSEQSTEFTRSTESFLS